ncbi:hypothetical protein JANAI62_20260 [Jannaschia pagri]|uniref:HlyD family secretion protein n=1 Tax=Jannaschia pagri TaxID=2829797 RepID=A0ABQ4NLY0_9RHOB|nr:MULTISPECIES: hypothetical protein [unclassified Jannaschia]GIT91569.1 hypothetical protein JANAI61_20270 [Jannaschia sp. AI_61]GIT95403.1 hypothetical protein JANAI62_20260 [Jannaschia sp. AI_62]
MKHISPTETLAATALPAGFAHKGEHPQIDLPFTALVGGRKLDGISLSITEALARGTLPPAMEGTVVPVAARVNFDGFSIILFMDAMIERTGAPEAETFTLRYVDPTASHLAPLRYLINSYIAGDMATVGGVMGYTGPLTAKGPAKTDTPGVMFKVQNIIRRSAVVGLSICLALIALNLAHNRAMYAYEARPVTVTAPGQTLLATAAGQLSYVDPKAGPGDVVYAIVANSGDYISVKMPCDCTVTPLRDFVEGATILPGMPLVQLANGQDGLVATTEISAEGAARLVDGDAAELVLADGTVVPVRPRILSGRLDSERSVPVSMTLLETGTAVPGDLARLRFRRHVLPPTWRAAMTE